MSEYINGWDMQDAISRCADLDAELARERRDHAKLVEAARECLELLEEWFPSMDDMRCADESDSQKIDRLKEALDAREELR